MSAQHTPGPVEAKRVDMVNAVIYGSDGMLIAKMAPHEHAWERAQYIAGTLNAAPELLEALRTIVEYDDAYGTLDTDDGAAKIDYARGILNGLAALAKVRP